MRQKPSDPISGEPIRACDCWLCRYSVDPYSMEECPHPHYPHQSHQEEKRLYLRKLVSEKTDA